MEKKRIFLHVPKTGGTTLDCAINNTDWVKEHDLFYYRHIQNDTKLSNAGDVFEKFNYAKYKEFDIFSMLRHPVERLVSEYYFVRDRKEFFSLLRKRPKNLKEYAQNSQTRNYMTAFFLGKRIYDTKPLTKDDLNKVIAAIDHYPIYVGILEEYDKSLNYLSDKMGVKWPKNIEIKRITLNRPKSNEISDDVRNIILENNQLDLELYNYCLAKLKTHNFKTSKNFSFNKDKYGYVMKYTERFILAELFSSKSNLNFFAKNFDFFKDLNLAIKSKTDFFDGKKYVNSWNKSLLNFVKEIDSTFPIDFESHKETDSLDLTKQIVNTIEKRSIQKSKAYKKPLSFNIQKIEIIKGIEKKKSFWNRLFS